MNSKENCESWKQRQGGIYHENKQDKYNVYKLKLKE